MCCKVNRNLNRRHARQKGSRTHGVRWGERVHKPNSPFHAIPEVPWIIQVTAVMVVGVNKGVDNTHNYNSSLEASQKSMSDEVVKQMASSRAV